MRSKNGITRSWKHIKTIDDARKFIEDNHVESRKELNDNFRGLQSICQKNGWLKDLEFPKGIHNFDNLVNPEDYQKFIDDLGILSIKELQDTLPGLYSRARNRGILKSLKFKEGSGTPQSWKHIKTVEDANKFIVDNNISTWASLKNFSGFFYRCKKLGICYCEEFCLKPNKIYWKETIKTLDDAQKYIEENKIQSPREFTEINSGLYSYCVDEGWARLLNYPNRKKSLGELHISKYIRENLQNSGEDFLDLLVLSSKFTGISEDFPYVFPDFLFQYRDDIFWIEYNGRQHYQFCSRFHKNIEDFQHQLKRDETIRNYCLSSDNNITFIEIPYIFDTYEEIENLLNKLIIEKDYSVDLDKINQELIKIENK